MASDTHRINEAGHRLDGIASIGADGTVCFVDEQMLVLKRLLGYECRCMPLAEVELWADDLKTRYRQFVARLRNA